MSALDPIKDAEQILRDFESETLQRLQTAEGAAEAPQMNLRLGASMTGALSGAYLGEEFIPADWASRIEGCGRLLELAKSLHE